MAEFPLWTYLLANVIHKYKDIALLSLAFLVCAHVGNLNKINIYDWAKKKMRSMNKELNYFAQEEVL